MPKIPLEVSPSLLDITGRGSEVFSPRRLIVRVPIIQKAVFWGKPQNIILGCSQLGLVLFIYVLISASYSSGVDCMLEYKIYALYINVADKTVYTVTS